MKRNSSCRGLSAERFFKELTVDKSYCGADSINVNVGTSSVDFDPGQKYVYQNAVFSVMFW